MIIVGCGVLDAPFNNKMFKMKAQHIMNFNPMMLMQLKSKLEGFNSRHPKLKMFFGDVFSKLETGDVLEISVTKADGSKIRTNFKVTEEDRQMLYDLSSMLGNK